MASEKLDRRVRKTRALLLKGLIQLMEEKDIKDISVKELSDLVDINRGTFYLHYNDIYDMLEKIEDELFLEFNDFLDHDLAEGGTLLSPYSTLLDLFTLLDKHKDLAKVMIGNHGDLAFVNRLKRLVEERLRHLFEISHNASNYEYYYPFIVSGCVGVIETWLNHPSPLAPNEIASLCSNMLNKGLTGLQR